MHEPAMWPGSARAALTLSFDDGLADTFRDTVFLLAESNISATYNVVANRVGATFEGMATAGWTDWACAQDHGHEIASHGANHLPLSGLAGEPGRLLRGWFAAPDRIAYARQLVALARGLTRYRAGRRGSGAPVDLVAEVLSSRTKIAGHLARYPIETFVYPAGRHDRAVRRTVAKAGYRSARGLEPGVNYSTTNRFALRALAVTSGSSADYYRPWLDWTLAHNGWLILAFHLVSDRNANKYPYYCSTESFRALIDCIRAAPFWVAPQRKVIQWWEKRGV